jgi:hypothetical protein
MWNKYLDDYVEENKGKVLNDIDQIKINIQKEINAKLEFEAKIKNNIPLTQNEQWLWDVIYSEIDSNIESADDEIEKMALGNMYIEHIVGNTFCVEHSTSMFNYILTDVPPWMIYLIVLNNLGIDYTSKFGFKNVKLKINRD